jgi:rfaE bifunctional protein kinase chain/domain
MTPQPVREAVKHARVLVVGDIMLDRYWFGDVERISPEAPVPVVRVSRTEERLGGAANVAWNMAAVGSQAVLLSVVGDDEAAESLEQHLAEQRIQSQLYRDPALSTTIKLRVIGRQQQLVRIDFENEPGHEALAAKLADFESKLPECDVVVLSDYGKGGLKHIERMIEQARDKGKPILVDPKGDDYSRYAGATLITDPSCPGIARIAGDRCAARDPQRGRHDPVQRC